MNFERYDIFPTPVFEFDVPPEIYAQLLSLCTTVDWDNAETVWNNGAYDRAIADMRSKRNRLLADTDYYALSDVTMSDDMKTYRQKLRDITKTYQAMDESGFAWPTKP